MLEEPRKSDIKELDAMIRKNAPNLAPHIMSGMLAYGHYHYKGKTREGGGRQFDDKPPRGRLLKRVHPLHGQIGRFQQPDRHPLRGASRRTPSCASGPAWRWARDSSRGRHS